MKASTTFAIVPADLRSAGIEYQDLLIRLLPILLLHHLYFTLISGTSALRRNWVLGSLIR